MLIQPYYMTNQSNRAVFKAHQALLALNDLETPGTSSTATPVEHVRESVSNVVLTDINLGISEVISTQPTTLSPKRGTTETERSSTSTGLLPHTRML